MHAEKELVVTKIMEIPIHNVTNAKTVISSELGNMTFDRGCLAAITQSAQSRLSSLGAQKIADQYIV